MLPSKLKNFNLFANGTSFIHQVPEVTLTKIAAKTEEYRGGGMLGPMMIDLGLEAFELEFTIGGLAVPIFRQFGAVGFDSMARFVGAYQSESTGFVSAAELVTRGKYTEFDPGTAKPGDDTEWKFKSAPVYLKWTINGSVEAEIDFINNVYMIGGVDRMAAIRAAIGQ